MPSPAQPVGDTCRLLDLAPQIRNKIWALVLINEHAWAEYERSSDLDDRQIVANQETSQSNGSVSEIGAVQQESPVQSTINHEAPLPGLLQVNRQIRSETLSMFFKYNTIDINCSRTPDRLEAWLRMMKSHVHLLNRLFLSVDLPITNFDFETFCSYSGNAPAAHNGANFYVYSVALKRYPVPGRFFSDTADDKRIEVSITEESIRTAVAQRLEGYDENWRRVDDGAPAYSRGDEADCLLGVMLMLNEMSDAYIGYAVARTYRERRERRERLEQWSRDTMWRQTRHRRG